MFRKILAVIAGLWVSMCVAQESTSPPAQPQVKVHMLNVCTPSADEQQEIALALSHIPQRPSFSQQYEPCLQLYQSLV